MPAHFALIGQASTGISKPLIARTRFDRLCDRRVPMRMLRCLLASATAALALCLALATAHAQTKISIGKVIGGDGFHIPSYVAMDQGFFKAEGLDAHFIELPGKAQVTAVLSGNLDFAPIPSEIGRAHV